MPYHNAFRLLAYGTETGYLRRYLRKGFDPHDYEYELAEYLDGEIDVRDENGDIDFDRLWEWIRDASKDDIEAFRAYVEQRGFSGEGPDRPAYEQMEYGRFVKPTWLVHFTDDPDEIADKGFVYGFEDYRGLALTTHYTDEVRKRGPGFNFAFVLGSRDARVAARDGKYGRQAVVFWGGGVEAYHYGDQEDQLIFWGPEIPADRIFAVHNGDDGWFVEDATGRVVFGIGPDAPHDERAGAKGFEDAAEWVTDNYRMLSRIEEKTRRRALRPARYHRTFRLVAADDDMREELAWRYRGAWSAERDIRRNQSKKLPAAETYYDAAVSEYRLNILAKAPWKELLAWAEAEPGLRRFPKELAQVRAKAESVPPPPDPEDFEGHLDDEVAEFYLDANDLARLIPLLDANDIPYDTHEFPTGKSVMTIDMGGDDSSWVVELGERLTYWQDAREWIESAADRAHEFFDERNETEEFWNDIGPGSYLYHATEEDNVDSILRTGLDARSATRGLSNRDIGSAVFAVGDGLIDDLSATLGPYGDAIIRIDLGVMKADGYMPEITGETPVREADTAEALARAVGYEYEADREGDYMDDTVAILGDIPAKYLSLYG